MQLQKKPKKKNWDTEGNGLVSSTGSPKDLMKHYNTGVRSFLLRLGKTGLLFLNKKKYFWSCILFYFKAYPRSL